MSVPATGRALHVDVPLSNVVVGRRPPGFIADQIIPTTSVDKQGGTYFKFNHGFNMMYEPGLTLRAPATPPRKVHMSVASDTFWVNNYALGTDWPVEDEVNADSLLNWARANAEMVTDRLLTDYEYRIMTLARTSTSVRTTMLVSCGWINNAAPIFSQMQAYIEQFRLATNGMRPNTMIVPQGLLQYFTTNAEIRDLLFGDRGGTASAQQLAGLLNLENVLTPQSMVNTFGETETDNGSWQAADMWGNDSIWLAHTKNFAGMYTDTWINAFRWTSPLLGVQWAVERYPYDQKRKAYELAVSYYQSEKVVSRDLAVRIIVNSQ